MKNELLSINLTAPPWRRLEYKFLTFMREQKSEVRNKLIETGTLDEATETALKAALDEFKKQHGKK